MTHLGDHQQGVRGGLGHQLLRGAAPLHHGGGARVGAQPGLQLLTGVPFHPVQPGGVRQGQLRLRQHRGRRLQDMHGHQRNTALTGPPGGPIEGLARGIGKVHTHQHPSDHGSLLDDTPKIGLPRRWGMQIYEDGLKRKLQHLY